MVKLAPWMGVEMYIFHHFLLPFFHLSGAFSLVYLLLISAHYDEKSDSGKDISSRLLFPFLPLKALFASRLVVVPCSYLSL